MWKGFCRIYEIYAIRWAELFPDGSRWGAVLHGHNPTTSLKGRSSPLHLSSLPTCSPFGSGMLRAWREARVWCARGRHVPLWGDVLSQLGGEDSVRGEKEAFAALSLLQQLLCQMYWSWASQLHWADGAEQPERSCWESGAASTAEMGSVMGSKGLLAPSKSAWHLPLPSASWVSSCWRLGYSATIAARWAPRKYVHFPQRPCYNGT